MDTEKKKSKRKDLDIQINELQYYISKLVYNLENMTLARGEVLDAALDIKKRYKRVRMGVTYKVEKLKAQLPTMENDANTST